jgi:hypothetical protein
MVNELTNMNTSECSLRNFPIKFYMLRLKNHLLRFLTFSTILPVWDVNLTFFACLEDRLNAVRSVKCSLLFAKYSQQLRSETSCKINTRNDRYTLVLALQNLNCSGVLRMAVTQA